MHYISCFWLLLVLDSLIVLISFSVFVCVWIFVLFYFSTVWVLSNKLGGLFYCLWNVISSKFIDLFWFILGGLFILCLLCRLCLLLYFSYSNFISFDVCQCIGYQWYWMYIFYSKNIVFCNIILESDYYVGDLRLLQCNYSLYLLSLVIYKFWVTSVDVIHSYCIGSLGIKIENQVVAMN